MPITPKRGSLFHAETHKQHGSEYPLWLVSMASASQKLLDLIKNRILITKKSHMVLAWKFNQLCAGNTLSHVACMLHVDHTLCGTVQNERRHAGRGQDMAHVDLAVHSHNGRCGARACRCPEI